MTSYSFPFFARYKPPIQVMISTFKPYGPSFLCLAQLFLRSNRPKFFLTEQLIDVLTTEA